MCKMLMRYDDDLIDSSDVDGVVLKEDWKDKVKYYACEDNGKFYVQTDPESEEWSASFNTQKLAEQYIKFMENV